LERVLTTSFAAADLIRHLRDEGFSGIVKAIALWEGIRYAEGHFKLLVRGLQLIPDDSAKRPKEGLIEGS
jgi:hypothetical protein